MTRGRVALAVLAAAVVLAGTSGVRPHTVGAGSSRGVAAQPSVAARSPVAAARAAPPIRESRPLALRLPAPHLCRGCWMPGPATTWQVQFSGRFDRSVDADAFDVDLFDTPASTVRVLRADGGRVVCYVNAGAWEAWRPDAARYPSSVLGRWMSGWPGERWLDIRRLDLLVPLIGSRLDHCRSKGFDAVDFDNVDGYANATGFRLAAADQLRFNAAIANAAHARGLSVALKNDLGQVRTLVPYFDWGINEQCAAFDECGLLEPFARAGRSVLEIEYDLPLASFCPAAADRGFYAMRKHRSLDAYREACP